MSSTYISNLHVKGFRSFKLLDIQFNPKFNFIIGPNGCGKTSILRAIIMAYSDSERHDSRLQPDFEVWIDYIYKTKKHRIGVVPYDGTMLKNEYRNYPSISPNKPPSYSECEPYYSYQAKDVKFAPLVLGAFRRVEYKKINGMMREENITNCIESYINNAPRSLSGGYLPDIKQWMINRYFQIDKAWAEMEKDNWNWLIENLDKLAPQESSFKFVKIERDLEPVFSLNNKECYLEELSTGFQSILSMVLAIFEWIENTNEREDKLVKSAKGIVIIDELDVHLHPEWQLTLRESLETIFPKLQFIVTTHSPHLISSAKEDEIIVIPEGEDVINLKPNEHKFSGWNTDQILSELMGVKSLYNKEYFTIIQKGMDYIEKCDIEGLSNIIEELEKIAHPSDTIISVLKMEKAALILKD